MSKKNQLAKALQRARRKRGWSILGASQRMGLPSHTSLRTLEGLNPDREPGGPNCKLSTVLSIVEAYWPDVTLEHFVGRTLLFKAVPKSAAADRVLKKLSTG